MRNTRAIIAAIVFAAATTAPHAQQNRASSPGEASVATSLPVPTPTQHPAWSRNISELWLAPDLGSISASSGRTALAQAARLITDHEYSRALALLSPPASRQGVLGQYATYYTGVAQLNTGRPADAQKTFKALRNEKPGGYLGEATAFGIADAALDQNEPKTAVDIYEDLARGKPASMEDVLLRLGRAYKAAGDNTKAAETFVRLYYEFAMSDEAAEAGVELSALGNLQPLTAGSRRYELELGRAERFFGAKQYGAARAGFETLSKVENASDSELIALRLAECDYFTKRYRDAREGVRPFVSRASRQAEAMFFFASASRELNDTGTFLQISQRIINDYPNDSWAEEAMNALATYYVRNDNDDRADEIFRDMRNRFPKGNNGERAAWKAGWRAYRDNKYADTVRFFDSGALNYPRSDYRPAWLYWAGRAHEALGHQQEADDRYAVVIADYLNTYYGRLAVTHLGDRAEAFVASVRATQAAEDVPPAAPLPGNAPVVRTLLAGGLYDAAMDELRYARRMWGNSPAIDATIAWADQQRSRDESGMERFQLLRGAINTMKRAYPQFMTVDGNELPRDVQTVIFPIAYWDLVKKYSTENGLDPYLFAALISQESTFVADIRSHANAYGLTQLLPSTARQLARQVDLSYSARLLTNPDANLRMGSRYFADKIRQFGAVHLALASYNAGEGRVRQWIAQRPGLPRDEFIDDIPFQETSGYVRKIMSTAEDYRRLYGDGAAMADVLDKTPSAFAAPSSDKPAPSAKAAAPAKKKPTPKVTPTPRKAKPKAKKR